MPSQPQKQHVSSVGGRAKFDATIKLVSEEDPIPPDVRRVVSFSEIRDGSAGSTLAKWHAIHNQKPHLVSFGCVDCGRPIVLRRDATEDEFRYSFRCFPGANHVCPAFQKAGYVAEPIALTRESISDFETDIDEISLNLKSRPRLKPLDEEPRLPPEDRHRKISDHTDSISLLGLLEVLIENSGLCFYDPKRRGTCDFRDLLGHVQQYMSKSPKIRDHYGPKIVMPELLDDAAYLCAIEKASEAKTLRHSALIGGFILIARIEVDPMRWTTGT